MPSTQRFCSGDGSDTLIDLRSGEHYHNAHGALRESQWVFIDTPNIQHRASKQEHFNVLEVGLGTALNARLFYALAKDLKCQINFTSYEPYPIEGHRFRSLNHHQYFNDPQLEAFLYQFFENPCDGAVFEQEFFRLELQYQPFHPGVTRPTPFDHIVMDAFSPKTCPELWKKENLLALSNLMATNASFSTYCVAGNVRRSLAALGLQVNRFPGPPGKRQILLAFKPCKTEQTT